MTRIHNTRTDPPKGPIPRRDEHKPRITRQKAKRMGEDAEYNAVRDIYLRENPQCCWCMNKATQVHHICGGIHRRQGLVNTETWLPVCESCHETVAGFSVRVQLYIKYETSQRAIERCRQPRRT